jgi:predicted dehydrogenase
VEIVALADTFADRLNGLKKEFKVPDNRCFVGLDAYKELLALDDVNLVILATPPGFRPVQFAEAIRRGKNVFMEKPVAVCPAGIKMVIESSQQASQTGLAVVAGTQRRHEPKYVETMKRIHDGAIGQIVSAQCYWNMGGLLVNKRQPNQGDVEWQIRNWLYFTWLSGDHICEQHVHNIDVINWAFKEPPTRAFAMGSPAARIGEKYGNIYDHFIVEFWYGAQGVRTISSCRQTDKCSDRISERVVGAKGVSDCAGKIWDHKGKVTWEYKGDYPNPYVREHADLIASIRGGPHFNEAKQVAESTLAAVMARMSAYTGREIQWSWAIKTSKLDLVPKDLQFGPKPVDPVAKPGVTQLV